MNILIVANHFAVCSARYAADAFTRLGHTVRHVGTPMGRNIWGIEVPEEYVWEPEDADWTSNAANGWDVYDDIQFDLIIVMDSDPEVLRWVGEWQDIRHFAKETIVWGVDNHCRDYRRPYFDHYFLAHKSVSVMTWEPRTKAKKQPGDIVWADELEPPDMTWLPVGYDPVAFPPSPIPWNEREYDVCCLGVMYPKRWELVNAMRAAGLKVLAGSGLVYEAYRDAYHNSRVALVSSFNGDLPIRLFEGAGMGCVPLHDPIADLALLGDDPGALYTTVEEAVNQAKMIARTPVHPGTAERGAASCVAWAQSHTWDARAQVIIDWLSESPKGKARS